MEKKYLVPGINKSENIGGTEELVKHGSNTEANDTEGGQDNFYENTSLDYNMEGESLW